VRPSDASPFLRSGAAPIAARVAAASAPAILVATAVAALALGACVSPLARSTALPDPAAILAAHPELRTVAADPARHRLQVVLGTIVERAGSRPRLVQRAYRAGEEYLYPASTVKLLGAVAALERLEELRRETGLPIDADTALVYHPLFAGEQLEDRDPTHLADGRLTVRHLIRQVFLVSDNEAFNKLYELVGQDRLARTAERAGLRGVRIVHRLSEPRSAEENLRSPRIDLVGHGSTDEPRFSHTLPERTAQPLARSRRGPAGLRIGTAFFEDDERVVGPMSFAAKNRFPLAELQRALCMVARPDADCGGPGFRLSADDRALLLEAMGQLLAESDDPVYDPAQHRDEDVEFLLPGLRRVVPAERLRVHGKSGQAYGFTLDNAWVVNTADGRSFFLAAALYTNADGVLNDDLYDYDTVALPFLADLGEAVARALWSAPPGPAGVADAPMPRALAPR
jgi:hypothetical protein